MKKLLEDLSAWQLNAVNLSRAGLESSTTFWRQVWVQISIFKVIDCNKLVYTPTFSNGYLFVHMTPEKSKHEQQNINVSQNKTEEIIFIWIISYSFWQYDIDSHEEENNSEEIELLCVITVIVSCPIKTKISRNTRFVDRIWSRDIYMQNLRHARSTALQVRHKAGCSTAKISGRSSAAGNLRSGPPCRIPSRRLAETKSFSCLTNTLRTMDE